MAYKQHVDVSTGIEDSLMQTPNGVEGIYFSLGGNTATANQFFLTDSTKHFLRGALYFDATPNADSLGIVNDFLKKDLQHLINTLKWKPALPAGIKNPGGHCRGSEQTTVYFSTALYFQSFFTSSFGISFFLLVRYSDHPIRHD